MILQKVLLLIVKAMRNLQLSPGMLSVFPLGIEGTKVVA